MIKHPNEGSTCYQERDKDTSLQKTLESNPK